MSVLALPITLPIPVPLVRVDVSVVKRWVGHADDVGLFDYSMLSTQLVS